MTRQEARVLQKAYRAKAEADKRAADEAREAKRNAAIAQARAHAEREARYQGWLYRESQREAHCMHRHRPAPWGHGGHAHAGKTPPGPLPPEAPRPKRMAVVGGRGHLFTAMLLAAAHGGRR